MSEILSRLKYFLNLILDLGKGLLNGGADSKYTRLQKGGHWSVFFAQLKMLVTYLS